MGRTLGEQFLDWAATDPDRPFTHLRTGDASAKTSYGEAAVLVAGIVDQLRSCGLQRGDRLACYLDDVYQSIYWFVACACIGVAPVPLDPVATPRYLKELIRISESKAAFTTAQHSGRLNDLDVPVLQWSRTTPTRTVAEALASLRPNLPAPDDLFMIQPSSGTTGEPKLMLRDHHPMIRSSERLRFEHAGSPPEQLRRLMSNPLTHGAGIIDLCGVIGSGAEACVTSRPNVETSLDEVRALDPHIFVLVPRILMRLYEQYQDRSGAASTQRMLGPSARMIHFGGAPLAPELKAFFRGQQLQVLEVYGCTECGIIAMSSPTQQRDGWSKIIDDMEVTVAEDGELLVRSPVKMLGYLGRDEETRSSYTPDGFYKTGDLGAVEDGWVRISGRKKDVFGSITGGIIFPARIEDMIEAIPSVRQAVLFGSGRAFLVALIYVEQRHSEPSIAGYLLEHLLRINDKLEPEEQIRRFHLLEQPIPRDLYSQVGQGKAKRNRPGVASFYQQVINDLYASGEPRSGCVLVPPPGSLRTEAPD